MKKTWLPVCLMALFAQQISAQTVSKNTADTSKVVTITSAFKPSLRPSSKINFTAATPFIDNSKVTMQYVVPAQNISFGYQAVAVTPLAYVADSTKAQKRNHFIKVGLGNYNAMIAEAGFNVGDGIKNNTFITGGLQKIKGALFAVKVERITDSDNIKLTFNFPATGVMSYEITPEIFKAKTYFELCWSRQEGKFIIVPLDVITKAPYYFILKSTGINLASIYFDTSFKQGMIVFNGLPVSDEKFEKVPGGKVFINKFIAEYFPSSKKYLVDDVVSKRNIMSDLHHLDSIVALEQQVDLLTTLVSNLINNQSQPTWSNTFLDNMKNNSVTTLKTVDAINTELGKTKSNIRKIQKDYLDSKK
jgi:hypothetical protein